MAETTAAVHAEIDVASVVVTIGGQELKPPVTLSGLSVERRVNELPKATIRILDGSPYKQDFKGSSGKFKPGDAVKITMGYHKDLDEAVKIALRDAIKFISKTKGLTADDAYALCSIAVDLRVTQIVDGNKGIHAMIPKSIFKK